MLFINDHEPQVVEVYLVLNQSVSSNSQIRFAAKDLSPRLTFGRLVKRPRQQRHSIGPARPRRKHISQQLPRRQVVLRRKNLRRRHQRGLIAVLDSDQRSLHGHDRLPRPHISLQQTSHRLRPAHIIRNLT